jgi:protoporphyrinogen oxidase
MGVLNIGLEDVLKSKNDVLILGGGLTGLSAGYVLARNDFPVTLYEADSAVGGIAKTIEHHGFRFDLGGHRFFTQNQRIDSFVKDLLDGELITVLRRSKILLQGRYFDYPLKPLSAAFGIGIPTTLRILSDYGIELMKRIFKDPKSVSLEDWVVAHFGRAMFNIFFKEYSEKVWGIDCSRISAEWVDRRIQGLSLSKAIVNAVFKKRAGDIPTLVDSFTYPRLGIGRISDVLKDGIEMSGAVFTRTRVEQIDHTGGRIESIVVNSGGASRREHGNQFVSSMPVTSFVKMLNPAPPERIKAAASTLMFRDLLIAAVMIDRPRVTDQTWIYIPGRKVPFGRIHEPTNWSGDMAPQGKTLLVLEFFCFKGDDIWNADDRKIADIGIDHLEQLGFVNRSEVIDSVIVRVPNAYPLFEVGYEKYFNEIATYLAGFENLQSMGRSGLFRYYNMDHAIESGLSAAEKITRSS